MGAGTSPTIGKDGTIFCGWDKLYAVNPDGTVKWKYDPGSHNVIEGGTPCISADGTIYFGTRREPYNGGEIIAVDSNGAEKWRKRICNVWCWFAPVISEDGTVYIGSSTDEFDGEGYISVGYLYAFNVKDPDAPSDPIISGPRDVDVKTETNYSFQSTSLLGNDVYYWIDWGDGDWKRDIWVGPFVSGENGKIGHTWSKTGTYTIKTRCKDSDNLWSDWSEFDITVIKSRNHATSVSVWLRFLDSFPILQRILNILSVH